MSYPTLVVRRASAKIDPASVCKHIRWEKERTLSLTKPNAPIRKYSRALLIVGDHIAVYTVSYLLTYRLNRVQNAHLLYPLSPGLHCFHSRCASAVDPREPRFRKHHRTRTSTSGRSDDGYGYGTRAGTEPPICLCGTGVHPRGRPQGNGYY